MQDMKELNQIVNSNDISNEPILNLDNAPSNRRLSLQKSQTQTVESLPSQTIEQTLLETENINDLPMNPSSLLSSSPHSRSARRRLRSDSSDSNKESSSSKIMKNQVKFKDDNHNDNNNVNENDKKDENFSKPEFARNRSSSIEKRGRFVRSTDF